MMKLLPISKSEESRMSTLQELVLAADPNVFSKVHSQSSVSDRIAFLEIQNFVASRVGDYVYLETGSFLGGTLVPHCADARCQKFIRLMLVLSPPQTRRRKSRATTAFIPVQR